ncbi:MAG: GreA/GreB family elongation factor [Oscillospiraceae bacterium]|nr:GreA/GreB family elongation factor [Oscillospiraceae bacterium]
MNNELTAQDLKKMQEELDYRRITLMPELLEEVKRTRAFGDLSENYEYKVAKQEQNRNRSRIRYLERMIASAHVIEDTSAVDEVGLFDKVTLKMMGKEKVIQVVSTVRCDALKGLISLESPMGKAVLGRKVGDVIHVQVNAASGYDAEILAIEKMTDDGSAPLVRF